MSFVRAERLLALLFALLSAWSWLGCTAHAQTQTFNVGVGLGTGFQRGTGQLGSADMSPLYLDVAARRFIDEQADVALGGSLRLELERNSAVAIVPRAELRHFAGSLELRPGLGLPLFFAPETMFGPEASFGLRQPMGPALGMFATLSASAFVIGSDVPKDTAVLMINLAIGADLQI